MMASEQRSANLLAAEASEASQSQTQPEPQTQSQSESQSAAHTLNYNLNSDSPSSRRSYELHSSRYQTRFAYSPQEVQALRQALKKSGLFRLAFYFLDYILRAQNALFEQIYSQQDGTRIIASLAMLSMLLASIYGVTMGMYNGVLQAISSMIKLPVLFLSTAAICIPSLYTFNVLLGQGFRFFQTVALMVTTLATTAILLASLAPIAFFFTLTTQNYAFLMLMHVAIFGLCGIYGVRYLYRGCAYLAFRMEQPLNNSLLRLWIGIYAVVGMQLGWRLRPFLGNLNSPFQVLREQTDGNFYTAVWNAILNMVLGPETW